MKRQLVRTLLTGPAIAGVMAGLAAGPGADTASAQDRCELPQQVVVGERGNQVVFERRGARSEGAVLEELHWLTLLKWGASLILPALARDELAIYVHESSRAGFLAEYEDIDTFKANWFFVACREGRQFRAARAFARRIEARSAVRSEGLSHGSELYVGLTIPVDEQPYVVLRGNASTGR